MQSTHLPALIFSGSRRGFSFVEAMISVALFGLFTLLLFFLFNFGQGQFKIGQMKHGFSNDIRMVSLLLRKDLSQACMQGCSQGPVRTVNAKIQGTVVSCLRQSISFPTLSNWDDTANRYNANTGLPNYDAYILWASTNQNPSGPLYRIEILDPNNRGENMDVATMTSATTAIFNGSNPSVVNYGSGRFKFARSFPGVSHFQVDFRSLVDQPTQVEVVLRFLGEAHTHTGINRLESCEVQFRCTPGNHD